MPRIHIQQSGLSLVELMIAMALGLIIMIAVGGLFINSSRSNAELQKSAQQIENGRYAAEILADDLKHAGYFGEFFASIALAGTPDPCETNSATNLYNAMALPVQVYRAPNFATRPAIAGTTCGAVIANTNLAAGSDVIVVRRASTATLADGATAVSSDAYLQANSLSAEIQFGNGAAFTYTARRKADGTATTIVDKTALMAAPTRKYEVHVYFIAPCSQDHDESGQRDKDLKYSEIARTVNTGQDWRCGNRNRLRHGRSTHQDRDASGEFAGWQPSVAESRKYLFHKHASTAEKKSKWSRPTYP